MADQSEHNMDGLEQAEKADANTESASAANPFQIAGNGIKILLGLLSGSGIARAGISISVGGKNPLTAGARRQEQEEKDALLNAAVTASLKERHDMATAPEEEPDPARAPEEVKFEFARAAPPASLKPVKSSSGIRGSGAPERTLSEAEIRAGARLMTYEEAREALANAEGLWGYVKGSWAWAGATGKLYGAMRDLEHSHVIVNIEFFEGQEEKPFIVYRDETSGRYYINPSDPHYIDTLDQAYELNRKIARQINDGHKLGDETATADSAQELTQTLENTLDESWTGRIYLTWRGVQKLPEHVVDRTWGASYRTGQRLKKAWRGTMRWLGFSKDEPEKPPLAATALKPSEEFQETAAASKLLDIPSCAKSAPRLSEQSAVLFPKGFRPHIPPSLSRGFSARSEENLPTRQAYQNLAKELGTPSGQKTQDEAPAQKPEIKAEPEISTET